MGKLAAAFSLFQNRKRHPAIRFRKNADAPGNSGLANTNKPKTSTVSGRLVHLSSAFYRHRLDLRANIEQALHHLDS
jgi:hypothetical protein